MNQLGASSIHHFSQGRLVRSTPLEWAAKGCRSVTRFNEISATLARF